MNCIFIDTAGFLALWNSRDQWNRRATEVFKELVKRGEDFCTSSYVLLECANAAARQPFRGDVVELRDQFQSSGRLLIPSIEDELTAWHDYAQGRAGDAGIVDHVSFSIMRRMKIMRVFTNDRHFGAAGFETLF